MCDQKMDSTALRYAIFLALRASLSPIKVTPNDDSTVLKVTDLRLVSL